MSFDMDRRRFLVATTALTFPVAAGCIGGNGGGSGEGGDGDGDGGTGTTTAAAAPTEGEDTTGIGGGNESTAGTPDGTAGADTTVTMVNTAFDPVRASVDPGTTVEWVNEDGFAHDVTSTRFHDSAAQWDIGEEVSSGGSVTHTFDGEGVYEYYCTIHGETSMCGAVLVGDASLPEGALPCESDGDGSGDDGGGGGGDGDDGYY